MEIKIAPESYRKEILTIHQRAFGDEEGPVIVKLVDDLLDDITAKPILSLVAVEGEKSIGHILFTKVEISQTRAPVSARILAPLAVLPDYQDNGVGQGLIYEGLDQLKNAGVDIVFVLGHPGYYPRCGFTPAGVHGLEAPYPIPRAHAGAWMVKDLRGCHLDNIRGNITCSDVLNEPQHWRE